MINEDNGDVDDVQGLEIPWTLAVCYEDSFDACYVTDTREIGGSDVINDECGSWDYGRCFRERQN